MTTPHEQASHLASTIEHFLTVRSECFALGSVMGETRAALVAALEPLFAREPQDTSGPHCDATRDERDTHAAMCKALDVPAANTWQVLIRTVEQQRRGLEDERARSYTLESRVREEVEYTTHARKDRADAEEALAAANARITELEAQHTLDANAIRLLEINLANEDARALAAEKRVAEIEAQVAAMQRMDEVQLKSLCDAVSMPGGSWGELVRVLRATYAPPQWPPLSLPDNYRIEGGFVTNGQITVQATSDVLMIRTATGDGAWAPLDAVKVAIAEQEKKK